MDAVMKTRLERMSNLEKSLKKAERGEDYRQIMNVMAGHSFCHNTHETWADANPFFVFADAE